MSSRPHYILHVTGDRGSADGQLVTTLRTSVRTKQKSSRFGMPASYVFLSYVITV